MNDFSTNDESISFEVLIDYVDGILDAKSREKVESYIEKSSECSEIVDGIIWYYQTYGRDRENLENYLLETKKGILDVLHPALQEPSVKPEVRPLWLRISRVAAVVLLLVIPALLVVNGTKSETTLLNEYLSIPYDKPPVARGDVDQNTTLWNQVALLYGNQDYYGAITSLEAIIERKETLAMAHFYTGLCYLYLENPRPGMAISHLQKVVESENPFMEQGLWYLSLAYLQNDQKTLCKQILERIEGYKVEEAQKLLGKLNR